MALSTRFTELVGCEVPIQLAPMSGITTPELVAAVDDAGGMGSIGAGPLPAPALAALLEQIRALTDGPLLVNVLMPLVDVEVVAVAAGHSQIVDFYHGAPEPSLVQMVHEANCLAGWQVGSVAEALAAVDAGCDVLTVRGVEGGGRMYGSESLWPLLADVVERVDVPVLAAGGIADARQTAAALALGAGGVRMGTRFVATVESGAHPAYKEAIVGAAGGSTVLTDEFHVGWPSDERSSRVLRASLEAARSHQGDVVGEIAFGTEAMGVPRLGVVPPLASATGSVAAMAMYAGESVRFVDAVEPAGDVVRRIAEGAERLLSSWAGER